MPDNEHRRDAFEAINSELDYQERVWPSPSDIPTLSVGEEILLMEEYLLKARAEWQQSRDPDERTALEMIRKITATGVRCMAHHGSIPREE